MNWRSAGVTVPPDDTSPQDVSPDDDEARPGEDVEVEAPVPDLERLVTEAMSQAAASGGGPELADLVERFWRLVPDEDLVGRSAGDMLTAVTAHLELAAERLPGQMKLSVERGPAHTAFLVV